MIEFLFEIGAKLWHTGATYNSPNFWTKIGKADLSDLLCLCVYRDKRLFYLGRPLDKGTGS